MDFVLILHTHLPYVLGHGRWPHGSDWLMEAATESYLPLLEVLHDARRDRIDTPITIGVTPVIAAQLSAPEFPAELRAFIAQRLAACDDAERELTASGETSLVSIVQWWRQWYAGRATQFDALEGGIVGALGELEGDGRIEIMSSAATHGFLPLLGRDESIRLQLFAGQDEHKRVFGRAATGCWLPECAYRPGGTWAPWPSVVPRERVGIETFLEESGYRYIVVDAHLARAGTPFEPYSDSPATPVVPGDLSPYRNYRIGGNTSAVRALVRDPISTRQVWSRDGGYPGGADYLEFHKIRFPGGLQLWKITGPGVSLGDKQQYDVARARDLAREHARHFGTVLQRISEGESTTGSRALVAPFDTELFGHWWFEGPAFLANTYRVIHDTHGARPVTASRHVRSAKTSRPLNLPAGSWGANGDFSYWLNDRTAWTWERMWPLEDRFWNIAAAALQRPHCHVVLAQAARELLLAQASDWQFMISASEVPDYGERRFRLHADDAEQLVSALERNGDLTDANALAAELYARDAIFPLVLDAVARVTANEAVALA